MISTDKVNWTNSVQFNVYYGESADYPTEQTVYAKPEKFYNTGWYAIEGTVQREKLISESKSLTFHYENPWEHTEGELIPAKPINNYKVRFAYFEIDDPEFGHCTYKPFYLFVKTQSGWKVVKDIKVKTNSG